MQLGRIAHYCDSIGRIRVLARAVLRLLLLNFSHLPTSALPFRSEGAVRGNNWRFVRALVWFASWAGGILILTTATTGSGIVANNYVRCLDIAGGIIVTAAAVQYGLFENYFAGETTSLSGVILPAAGAQ